VRAGFRARAGGRHRAHPWQTDTCIGNWHYQRDVKYKTPKTVIDMLVDIVSRNGNLLLNFPLPGSGALDDRELAILAEITKWIGGEQRRHLCHAPVEDLRRGPGAKVKGSAHFNENGRKDLTAEDVRFTTKGKTLYAFLMGWPGKEAMVARWRAREYRTLARSATWNCWVQGQAKVDAGRSRPEGRDARGEAQRSRGYAEGGVGVGSKPAR